MPASWEHPYGFAIQEPCLFVDSDGRAPEGPDMGGGRPGLAENFKSNCVPEAGAIMPDGSTPPPEGSSCEGDDGDNSCFDWRDSNRPDGPHQAPQLDPGNVPPDWSLIDYYHSRPSPPSPNPDGQYPNGNHVGMVIGGCVANCHGGKMRYYDPTIPHIPHTQYPSVPVSIVVRPW